MLGTLFAIFLMASSCAVVIMLQFDWNLASLLSLTFTAGTFWPQGKVMYNKFELWSKYQAVNKLCKATFVTEVFIIIILMLNLRRFNKSINKSNDHDSYGNEVFNKPMAQKPN